MGVKGWVLWFWEVWIGGKRWGVVGWLEVGGRWMCGFATIRGGREREGEGESWRLEVRKKTKAIFLLE